MRPQHETRSLPTTAKRLLALAAELAAAAIEAFADIPARPRIEIARAGRGSIVAGRRSGRVILLGPLVLVLTLLAALLSRPVSAQQATVDGGTWNFGTGSTANLVEMKLTGLPSEGLGDADISVAFDSAVLAITACDSGDLAGVCNPNSPGGPARAAGFTVPAITSEPVVIATLTFDCTGAVGTSSDLIITVNVLEDGTVGDPQNIAATVQNGTVVCGEACFGDFNLDGTITISDVLLIKPAFGSQAGDPNYDQIVDLNADGRITIIDVLLLKPVFGTSCP